MSIFDAFRRALGGGREAAGPEPATLDEALEFFESERLDEAEATARNILEHDPRDAAARHLLGLIALQRGNAAAALLEIDAALALKPDSGLFHMNRGNALLALDYPEDARASFSQAARLDPGRVAAWFNLGQLELAENDVAAAEESFRRVLALAPDMTDARLGLARALMRRPEPERPNDEVVALLEDGWQRMNPAAEARYLLAEALRGRSRFAEAAAHFEQLVAERPGRVELHNQLGNCYNKLGRMREAIAEYRQVLKLAPDFTDAHSAILGCLNYVPEVTAQEVFEAHRNWATAVARPLYPAAPAFPNLRDPDRRLRIGYVSPDFRRHPVSALFAPVLERHDASGYETFCYYTLPRGDAVTDRLRRAASHWRDVADLPDAALADAVRADGIDILIDLAGHTMHSRLGVFARRPAPVQASWLGYFNTTGVETIDWWVSDLVTSPPGQERYFVERLWRLPSTRLCYEAPTYMPQVAPLPALTTGRITFGSLNNLAKVNPGVLSVWARVLAAVPGSRLLLQATALRESESRARFLRDAAAAGIAAERVDLRPFAPLDAFARTYGEIDIALDPFPFCGGMTSFDALWMGVPVVTLPAEMVPGRQTASMLANLRLDSLIARDADDYVRIAVDLASDLDRLTDLRRGLRPRFEASPLADYDRFTRDLEGAFRAMWRTWAGT